MMRSRWSKWLSGVGGVVLIGGLVLANYGAGVTPAEAHHGYQNPFKQILSKLNLILEKLNAGGGGAPSPSPGGGAGSQSLRWDTNNPALRFTVLTDFGSAAVRDNNTGLVWEQSPSTIPLVTGTVPVKTMWIDARTQCLEKNVGGTRGWRLPSVVELASLIDPSLGKPFLPVNVFTGVQLDTYWSATTNAAVNPGANSAKFLLNFDDGKVSYLAPTGGSANFWCVRGPMSESVH
ncbi:MAG: DUF1566 domain-containing protein [Nitrospiraceae bacterium]